MVEIYLYRPLTLKQVIWFEEHPVGELVCSGPACWSYCNEFNCWSCYGEAYRALFGEVVFNG